MPKSYRIRTQPGVDKSIQIKLDQDFEFLEILSLKILQSDIYTRLCSDYGVVVGRVLTNGGTGLPNAKVSVFIPISEEDQLNPIISELYPYRNLDDLNVDGYRYNLLPYKPSYTGHAATGTFPEREDILTDFSLVEVYNNYYKFTTKTNESGDYMIFGVPTGEQTIIMDVDLSDIGCFSLSPQDLINSGLAGEGQFDGNKFKTSSNLRELPQIINLNKIVEVQPLWGEPEVCLLGITRVDFDLTASSNINIQPTAVFMGSLISTTTEDFVKKNCKPKKNTGNLCDLVAGPGQILAIRQTINVDDNGKPILEQYKIEQDGKIIDGDGTWLINVPMNIDYVTTNEFGEQILSSDPKVGIPTKGKYRFKIKWQNEEGLQNTFQRGHYLVPNVKEHGWTSNGQITDPFNPDSATGFTFTIPTPAISLSGSPTTLTVPSNGGLVLQTTSNTNGFYIFINGSLYTGDLTSVPYIVGDTIQIISNGAIDETQPITVTYDYLPQTYFNVLRSYAFSLDWDDYVDQQSAIDCEDTFYLFNYNKIYTVSSFIDRYKNGKNKSRHLGIKEITDRTCQSENNKLPVNDVQRNFDFIVFAVQLIINILTFPIISIISLLHVIALIWPVLKYVLAIGIPALFGYLALQAMLVAIGGYPAFGIMAINIIYFAVYLAAGIIFGIKVSPMLIDFEGFKKIALPMISYPDCDACSCEDVLSTLEPLPDGDMPTPPGDVNTSFLADINSPGLFGSDSNQNPYYDYLNTNEPSMAANAQIDYLSMFGGVAIDGIWNKRGSRTFYTSSFLGGTPYYGYPTTEPLSQKLNSFNLRDKFFNDINVIQTSINGSLPINDQVFVTLVDPGVIGSIVSGDIVTFQNPSLSGEWNRITGLTATNQYNNNAITGITQTGIIPTVFTFGLTGDTTMVANTTVTVNLTGDTDTGFYAYPADMEYFQCITGLTVGDFLTQTTSGTFREDYLRHRVYYRYLSNTGAFTIESKIAIEQFSDYENLGIIFWVRGVDPNTQKQEIEYDLSKIFGQGFGQVVVSGQFKPNYPIRGYANGKHPIHHDAWNATDTPLTNPVFDNLFFPSFTFTPDVTLFTTYPSNGSSLPYYYLSTDKIPSPTPSGSVVTGGYTPYYINMFSYPTIESVLTTNNTVDTTSFSTNSLLPINTNNDYYVGGGSFTYTDPAPTSFGEEKFWAVYSPSYIGWFNVNFIGSIDFNKNTKIVMRSDRLPTSTNVDGTYNPNPGGGSSITSFGLQQNNDFAYYKVPEGGYVSFDATITITPDTPSGNSEDSDTSSTLLDSLTCENMTRLSCYDGYGTNFSVLDPCDTNPDGEYVKGGCYYLLNKKYIKNIGNDIDLFLEWKTRFLIMFAACRGVFGHMFQNNWINGVLYMPTFNKETTYNLYGVPKYRYCDDIVVFNDVNNNFFYRSSPWNGTNFVGAPRPIASGLLGPQPADDSANTRQILFPTTIMDMGNRDQFIGEICGNPAFEGKYIGNTFQSTSYNDGSDVLQLGIISRLLNATWSSSLLGTGDSSIDQFFSRSGYRIDGDIAQSFSINSEYQINPFITGNYTDPQIYIGEDGSNGTPVFGVFYNLSGGTEPYKNRRALSPGINIYNLTSPLLQTIYGYPNTQEVPLYKWQLSSTTSIFGNELNNWYTTPNTNLTSQGFYSKGYQSLDASNDDYFKTSSMGDFPPNLKFGFITNYDNTGTAISLPFPVPNPFLVGAPNHFYFGLKNGKTALNRFIKIYIDTTEE